MKYSILLVCGWLVCTHAAQAFERNRWRGLDVTVEELPEPTAIDGLAVAAVRAVGSDVPELVRRISVGWNNEVAANHIRTLTHEGWTIRSRIHHGRSEVLQWRGDGKQAELLWSTTDLHKPPGLVPLPAVTVPAGCYWGRTIHGSEHGQPYLQSTARCAIAPEKVLQTLHSQLQRERWRMRTSDTSRIVAYREQMTVYLTLAPLELSERRSGTSVVLLQVATPGATP